MGGRIEPRPERFGLLALQDWPGTFVEAKVNDLDKVTNPFLETGGKV